VLFQSKAKVATHSTAPILDNLFRLVTKHLTRQPQMTFVFDREADADFQLLQFLKQNPTFAFQIDNDENQPDVEAIRMRLLLLP
jgi:hypothetical protein